MQKNHILSRTLLLSQCFIFLAFTISLAENRLNLGAFTTTTAGTDSGYSISGTAVMARSGDSITYVATHVTGLKPNTVYGSHVHELPCNLSLGGGHYKINPADTGSVNEIWPILKTDANGIANAFVTSPKKVRPEGQSIVIHDFKGLKGKIACADLIDGNSESSFLTLGNIQKFPDTATGIQGSASMVRYKYEDSTIVSIRVSGLLPSTAYGCHVHLLPGAIQNGGGHYKIDPTITAAVDTNEIWLNFTTNATGGAALTVASHHVARPEAQSIVFHAPGGRKIGWVDLVAPASSGLLPNSIISGPLVRMNSASTTDYPNLDGLGLIIRGYGRTVATLRVNGLAKNTAYASHVHNLPCSQSLGGGHYKINDSIKTAIDTNEIWTMLKTDSLGLAVGFGFAPNHLAGPTAQSIVVHDSGAAVATRVACIDLSDITAGIYANPSNGKASRRMIDLGFTHLRKAAKGDFAFTLYNLEGVQVMAQSGSGSQILNLEHMTAGHYFTRIKFSGASESAMTQGIFIK